MTEPKKLNANELIAGLFFALHGLNALLESKGLLAENELADRLKRASSDRGLSSREVDVYLATWAVLRTGKIPKISDSGL